MVIPLIIESIDKSRIKSIGTSGSQSTIKLGNIYKMLTKIKLNKYQILDQVQDQAWNQVGLQVRNQVRMVGW